MYDIDMIEMEKKLDETMILDNINGSIDDRQSEIFCYYPVFYRSVILRAEKHSWREDENKLDIKIFEHFRWM